MEPEIILRSAAVVIALILLVSNFNLSSYWNKLIALFKRKPKPNVIDEEDVVADKPFLEIVDLWYSLKGKCTEEGLDQAAEKLDEVFPLFNSED